MTTVLHPTAGYILDVARGAEPGSLEGTQRSVLRRLADRVLEISQQPEQSEKRDLWYRHNRLESTRPLVLVFPEDSWEEIIPENQLQLQHPFWRQIEWYLRHLVYRSERILDDFVIEPTLFVERVVRSSGFGLQPEFHRGAQPKSSYVWDPPLVDPSDISRLSVPTVEVDETATQRCYDAVGSALGDMLPVEINCRLPHANMIGEACLLRGIDRFMLDMYDRPSWLHELMTLIANATMALVGHLEGEGYLTLNNRGHYTDSGGVGWSDELPRPGSNANLVRLEDLWGFGVAQELVLVGPQQHEELVLNYQLPLLERCGLNAYGCCEPYTTKFDMLFDRIPRLRRVSVSPWCDVEVAAEKLGRRCIYSWKPNPAMVAGGFDRSAIRAYLRETLEIAHGCVLELVHKDTFTIDGEPARLEEWARIAREEIDRVA